MHKIELSVPIPSANTEEELIAQTQHLVLVWRAVLKVYSAQGNKVPTLSVRLPNKPVVAKASEFKEFQVPLLEHHKKFMPRYNVPEQVGALKKLFATGKSPEELIGLYEESRKVYPLTSWFTVIYNLSKVEKPVDVPEDSSFHRAELSEVDLEKLRARLANRE